MICVRSWLLHPLTAWGLLLLLSVSLLLLGYQLDQQANITINDLADMYSLASVLGVKAIAILYLLRAKSLLSAVMLLVIALLIWRISFFPIMVIGGYITTLVENLFAVLSTQLSIYPVLLLTIAILHGITVAIGLTITHAVIKYKTRLLLLICALPLLLLATTVSFSSQDDWRLAPYRFEQLNQSSLQTRLPTTNPYRDLLKQDGYNWRQQTLLYTGLVTYALIPKHGKWTQQVKGTLEYDLRNSGHFGSRYFTLSHLNAYWLANNHDTQRH